MYEATIDPMRYLYDRLSPGCYVIVDDYYVVTGCRRAVRNFCASRTIFPVLVDIDGVGVYFCK
ncbi:MAG: TylF/MycF/NovP-related O-methyltransferase [Rhodospirillales bacterium]